MTHVFNLFGDYVPEGCRRRGRPPHVVTAEKRKNVSSLFGLGYDEDYAAASLGVSRSTLEKYYKRELEEKALAAAQLQANMLALLIAQAEAGKVSAINSVFKQIEKRGAMNGGVASRKAAKPPKPGKKEQQRVAAHQVPQSWGDLMAKH